MLRAYLVLICAATLSYDTNYSAYQHIKERTATQAIVLPLDSLIYQQPITIQDVTPALLRRVNNI